jgi:chromatin remodeling complex protein RSC6
MSKVATKTTKTTTKKTSKSVTPIVEPEVPVVVPVAVVVPVEPTITETEQTETATAETATVEIETMKQRFEKLIKSKQDLTNELKREIQELRKMQRDHENAIKEASKKTKRKKTPRDDSNPRKPSGFASPVIVSDELYAFLAQFGVKNTDPIARTDVTRYITSYIKEHDLQNPEHRREIVPDAALNKLFGPAMEPKDPNDENSPLVYTYLKLQKYLSAHFPKKASA